jgi:hypothetical protein
MKVITLDANTADDDDDDDDDGNDWGRPAPIGTSHMIG